MRHRTPHQRWKGSVVRRGVQRFQWGTNPKESKWKKEKVQHISQLSEVWR